jgi:hypothetical protein
MPICPKPPALNLNVVWNDRKYSTAVIRRIPRGPGARDLGCAYVRHMEA